MTTTPPEAQQPGPAAAEPGAPFDFGRPLPDDGYVWWYVDALSEDGTQGITLIAMLGSVFSPYYAHARRRGPRDPLEHCALNVALYGRPGRWAMTERGRRDVASAPGTLVIGPSRLAWRGDELVIDVDEWTNPWPSRLRGRVCVRPLTAGGPPHRLDRAGLHRWWPIAPRARVEVDFSHPRLRWSGIGYLDRNDGDVPLERSFTGWHWSRAALPDGTVVVHYDTVERDGHRAPFSLHVDHRGARRVMDTPALRRLDGTLWRIDRETRSESGEVRVARTLEDTPFYARSVLDTVVAGERVQAMHESLDLGRFASRWVQRLLPFRMPRRAR